MSALSPFVPLALIGDVGGLELLVILGAVLMLFGGKGMPGIARSLGRMAETLRRASQDFKDQLMDGDRDAASSPPDSSMKPYISPDLHEGQGGLKDGSNADQHSSTAKTSKEVLSRDPAG